MNQSNALGRTFNYDSLKRLTAATNPESGAVAYTYDNVGNMLTKTDARPVTTCFGAWSAAVCDSSANKGYDGLNRPVTKSYSDGTPTVHYTYDVAASGLAAVANSLDGNGRRVVKNAGIKTIYVYNAAGSLTSETYPSGRVVATGYDAANRPITLTGNPTGQSTNYVTGVQYFANGGINTLTRGNGLTYSGAYNSRLQPTGITEQRSSDNSVLFSLGLNWTNASSKNNGTVQSLAATSNGLPFTQTFTYDALNRLKSASEGSAWSQSYNYDQYGNMWMPATTNGLPTPSIGSVAPTTNAYVATDGTVTNRNVNSTYDSAGNMTNFNSVQLSYDANNLQTAAGSNAYAYDGLGQRVSKTVGSNGPTTYYVYDAFGQLSAEYSTAALTTPPCTTCYLSVDHLGSSRMVTDSSAQIVALHDYAPFGQEIPSNVGGRTALWGASDNINQKFTGQERDSEANLDFFQARYMSSGLARFMSPDPANAGADLTNPQSWNGYAYVSGDPLDSADPTGLCGGLVAGISSDPYQGGGLRLLQLAAQYHFDVAFPYANQSKASGVLKVLAQSLGKTLGASKTAGAMVQDVIAQSAGANSGSLIGGWSGGAVAMQRGGVDPGNSSLAQLYLSPGGATLPQPSNSNLALSGSGVLDSLVNATSSAPPDAPSVDYPGTPNCGHDAACMMTNPANRLAINNLLATNNVQSCPNPTVFVSGIQKAPASFTLPSSGGGAGSSGGFWSTVVSYSCVSTSASNTTGSSGTVCSTNYTNVWVQ